jgi:hypothetical protein
MTRNRCPGTAARGNIDNWILPRQNRRRRVTDCEFRERRGQTLSGRVSVEPHRTQTASLVRRMGSTVRTVL